MINISTPKNLIFVDTSALKAVFDQNDDFHQQAIAVWEKAKEEKTGFVISNFILDEFYTLVRSHLGRLAVLQFYQDLVKSRAQLKIVRITIKDEVEAWDFFEKLSGRKLSFTDCTSFALMKRLGLTEAFAFDKHFKKAGFILKP